MNRCVLNDRIDSFYLVPKSTSDWRRLVVDGETNIAQVIGSDQSDPEGIDHLFFT